MFCPHFIGVSLWCDPTFEYCVPSWSPHYEKDKFLLERVQHRFIRILPGLTQLAYKHGLERLGLWTVEERRNRAENC